MKKRGKYFFLCIMLCLFTVGCGGKQEVPRHEDGRAIVYISKWALINPVIEQGVVEFNKTNPDYYVEVWNKDAEYEQTDWEREQIALTTGGGPDIVSQSGSLTFVDYVETGGFEDLMPYAERDFAQGELLDCCLYAFFRDGKVYALQPSFMVATVLGAKDVFGERTGWCFADAKQLMEENPQIPLFKNSGGTGKGGIYQSYLLQGGKDVYTDYETLKEVLGFDRKYDGCLQEDEEERIGENVLVIDANLTDPLDYVDWETSTGKELVPIGHFSRTGEGNENVGIALSIISSSGQKEGAWEFIKYLLSYDFQKAYNEYGISPRRDLFEEKLEYYSKPRTYTVCVEGQEVDVTAKHMLKRSSRNGVVEVECATPEQIEKFRDMVEHSKTRWELHDYNAVCIIREEADAFFEGQRSLDEVMDSIQNRMELYYAEKGNP